MQIKIDRLRAGAETARGIAVIIDVLRAFTCAPLLFSLGIEKSILVSNPEEDLQLKAADENLILIGEIEGIPIEGFDFGNSPGQLLRAQPSLFVDKTIVQRTSSGVQGVIAALSVAEEVLLGSFNLAQATAKYISAKKPEHVSLVAMGWSLREEAPEDEYCARYLAHLLGTGRYDHVAALREIIFHKSTRKFIKNNLDHFPAEDPIICLQRNIYDFALRAEWENGLAVVRKICIGPE